MAGAAPPWAPAVVGIEVRRPTGPARCRASEQTARRLAQLYGRPEIKDALGAVSTSTLATGWRSAHRDCCARCWVPQGLSPFDLELLIGPRPRRRGASFDTAGAGTAEGGAGHHPPRTGPSRA